MVYSYDVTRNVATTRRIDARKSGKRRRVGGKNLWTASEDEIIRRHYPDYAAICHKLSSRSNSAIRSRAATLRIQKKRHIWTAAEVGRLRRLYVGGAPRATILAELPEANWGQIKGILRMHRILRKHHTLKETRFPIINLIRDRAREMNLSMVDLDAMARSKRYFQKAQWHSNGLRGKYIVCAIQVLGGHMGVKWDSLSDG